MRYWYRATFPSRITDFFCSDNGSRYQSVRIRSGSPKHEVRENDGWLDIDIVEPSVTRSAALKELSDANNGANIILEIA